MGADEGDEDRSTTRPAGRYVIVAAVASVVFVGVSLAAGSGVAKYRWSAAFLVPLVWIVVLLRHRLALRPLHFGLFAFAILLHDLGAFGGYQTKVVGLQYDWIVHTFFGWVGGAILAETLSVKLGLGGRALGLLVVLAVTGLGALHEIMEAASTAALGTEYGMLVTGADDPYDTQGDLFCNVVGSSAAMLVRALRGRGRSA